MRVRCIYVALTIVSLYLCGAVIASKADDIRAFDEWYQGINHNEKVRLEMIDDEPGFIATGNLLNSEMALITPYEVFISSETVENDAILGDVIEDIYDENEDDQLKPVQLDALYVYYLYHKFCDKDPKFMWKLYFKALPDQYDTTIFFSKEDIEQLKGSVLYDAAIEERAFVDEKFKFLKEKLFDKNPEVFGECKPTLQQFKWSYATVMARKVDLVHANKNTKKERKFVAVAPYFDFMRHYPFTKVEWGYSSSTSTLHCEAHENVRKGQEVFRLYGELSNAELLKEQGYILEENIHNAVLFDNSLFVVDKKDPEHEKKQAAVNELLKKVKYMRMLDGGLSQELFDIAKTIAGKGDKAGDSLDTMYHAFMYLENLCERKLAQYPTTLQDDEKFMESAAFEELTSRAKNARMVVLEEKKILNTMKQEFNTMARKKLNEAKKRGIAIDLKDEL